MATSSTCGSATVHCSAATRSWSRNRPRREPPGGPGVRLDSHAVTGYVVPPTYDSLVAKLLVHQPTRALALAAMRRALAEFRIEGIHTTIPLHREIFNHSAFIAGQVDTTFIERNWQKS